MAKKEKDLELSEAKGKVWREADLIKTFKLTRIVTYSTPLLTEWLDVQPPQLSAGEQYVFDKTFLKGQRSISGWNEEDLKVKFIGPTVRGFFNCTRKKPKR